MTISEKKERKVTEVSKQEKYLQHWTRPHMKKKQKNNCIPKNLKVQ